MSRASYEGCTSLNVFAALYSLSDFRGCMPKPFLKTKPQDPRIEGKRVTIKYMNWTEDVILHDDAVYIEMEWKTRSRVLIKLLICALAYDPDVSRVGVITPRHSAVEDIEWTSQQRTGFLDSVREKWYKWINRLPTKAMFDRILSWKIGHHVPFRKQLASSLEGLPNDRPYQIFMHSEDEPTDYTLYIHSPYTINLDQDGSHHILEKQLKIADSVGAKGVVVHCAKGKNADNMYTNLKKIDMSKYKTDLLVETSSGQGSEVLSNPSDLNTFIDRLADPKIQVCLDTCHVFAAGYDPIEALSTLKGKVALVHYNNSRTPCGSRVDRHQYIVGHIDGRTMYRFALICTKLGIPMVTE